MSADENPEPKIREFTPADIWFWVIREDADPREAARYLRRQAAGLRPGEEPQGDILQVADALERSDARLLVSAVRRVVARHAAYFTREYERTIDSRCTQMVAWAEQLAGGML